MHLLIATPFDNTGLEILEAILENDELFQIKKEILTFGERETKFVAVRRTEKNF